MNAVTYAIVSHAIRWCNNILTETLGSHGTRIMGPCRDHLRVAVQELQEADAALRNFAAEKPAGHPVMECERAGWQKDGSFKARKIT